MIIPSGREVTRQREEREKRKQAGAELCQAQVKLGRDWLSCKLFLIWYLELTLANRNHSEIFGIS
jgi:hypothetical protein